jgi:hypothetical protein
VVGASADRQKYGNKVLRASTFKPLFCVSCVVYVERECER